MKNCDVIKDLMPLYVDGCCSEESAKLVSQHIEECEGCKKNYELMNKTFAMVDAPKPKNGYRRISQWKASLIQAVMLFVSFGIIAVGVIFEGNTPFGDMNGLWSVALIIPATGYLLSMANTFFVRMYKSRKSFSNASVVINTVLILMGYAWAFFHYEKGISFDSVYVLVGIGLSLAFCVMSRVISSRYALLMGKE